MRVVVVDAIAQEGHDYLRDRKFDVEQLHRPAPATLYAHLADA